MVVFTISYNVNDMRSPSVVYVLGELGGDVAIFFMKWNTVVDLLM